GDQRGRFAEVAAEAHHPHVRILLMERAQDGEGGITAAVVHEDDLVALAALRELRGERLVERSQALLFVIDRHDKRERDRRLLHRLRPTGASRWGGPRARPLDAFYLLHLSAMPPAPPRTLARVRLRPMVPLWPSPAATGALWHRRAGASTRWSVCMGPTT